MKRVAEDGQAGRTATLPSMDSPSDTTGYAAAAMKILSAAEECFRRFGMRTSLTDIAGEAGVSRPTVYRYFADRDDIMLALGLRQTRRFLAYAQTQLNDISDLRTQLITAVSLLMDGWPEGARLPAFRDPDVYWTVYRLVSRSIDYYRLVSEYLSPVLRQVPGVEGAHRAETVAEMVELIVRLILSVPQLPGAMTQLDTRYQFLDRYLATAIFMAPPDHDS